MITQLLFNAKADVNAVTCNGETPMMFSCGGTNIVSKYGTAYDYVTSKRHKLTLKYLTKRMCQEEQKKDERKSPAKVIDER